LDVNPFVWLAARDRQPATLGWLVVGAMVLVWLLCWAAWPVRWPSPQNFFITATLLNSTLAWLSRHAAAQHLGLARRDGSYELLLTTPLNPGDIVWGALEALRWNFRPLANFVFLLNLLMMMGGLLTRRWNETALVEYFVIWLCLLMWSWRLVRRLSRVLPVMWASLNCGRPAQAVWRTSGFNSWSWIWIVFNLQSLSRGFRWFPTGSVLELTFVLFVAMIWMIIWLVNVPKSASIAGICESRLIAEFREIVREPLPDPNDPRFKKWNVQERFPWGWELVQQQLHERLARRG
jgi:hypothetical protein